MTFIHNNIKIKYVNLGYLPNWPYHLISDEEMFDAFMSNVVIDKSECRYDETSKSYVGSKLESGQGFFFDNYPLLDEELSQPYCDLVEVISYFINLYKSETKSGKAPSIPAWVYSYMLGEVISINSDYRDIHELIKPLGLDNIDDVFTKCASNKCYRISTQWVNKHSHSEFSEKTVCLTGEFQYGTDAEVAELLRQNSVPYTFSFVPSVNYVVVGSAEGSEPNEHIIDSARSYGVEILPESQLILALQTISVSVTGGVAKRDLPVRPPTMFGEPHVMKAVRLLEVNPSAKWGTYPYQE